MHQKLKQRNESEKKKKKKLNFFRHFYERKSSLERKLEYHGIKIKVEHKRKKIHPVESEENKNDSDKFTRQELLILSNHQLELIMDTFESCIKRLSKELTELTEENERHADDKTGLKMTVQRLEELALRVMKPWVNKMPHSDEMTRVMLLN